ncbi:FkbM family methyltransferase [Planktomarina temperata]|nr:FkbM family methyltransferase [Planktomarina temperata]
MRLNLIFSSTKYLPPIKPRHEFKSQFGQDYYLEKMGLLVSNGFFVEVGCNHPIHNSNSHYLEKELGWTGVSIDGIDYGSKYKSERPNTIFINALVSNREDELDFFRVKDRDGWENQVSSIHKETLQMGKGFEAEVVKMPSVPISKIKEINRPIDLCLIDVEGHEFEVLQSIDFNNNAPSVLVIENNGQFYKRKSLVSFLKGKSYKHVARIGTADDIFVLQDTMQIAKHTIVKRE